MVTTSPTLPPHTIETPLTKTQLTQHATSLTNLQESVLKGHGRDHKVHIFATLEAGENATVKSWISSRSELRLSNALQQIQGTEAHRMNGKDGRVFMSGFLNASGYAHIGRDFSNFAQTHLNRIAASPVKLPTRRMNDHGASSTAFAPSEILGVSA